jgi:hypothetical protein
MRTGPDMQLPNQTTLSFPQDHFQESIITTKTVKQYHISNIEILPSRQADAQDAIILKRI